jgi:hypothetical protein
MAGFIRGNLLEISYTATRRKAAIQAPPDQEVNDLSTAWLRPEMVPWKPARFARLVAEVEEGHDAENDSRKPFEHEKPAPAAQAISYSQPATGKKCYRA